MLPFSDVRDASGVAVPRYGDLRAVGTMSE
jgi:hypothetical protein